MTNLATVELWLLDSTYKLGCTPEKQQQLKNAGELLEHKFREMRAANARMDNQKIAVMVALQLMQDVIELNQSLQVFNQSELLLTDIVEEVDQKVAEFKK